MNRFGGRAVQDNPRPASAFPSAGPKGGRGTTLAFLFCLAPILVGSAGLAAAGPVSVSEPRSLAALALAGAGWLAALALAPRVRDSRAVLVLLVAGALAVRAPWLALEPGLSDDLARYVWEGALVGAGRDPCALAPDAPELAAERARWPAASAAVAHAHVASAYPPLAELVHAGLVAAAGGPEPPARARLAVRGAALACDLLVLVPLLLLLARTGRPRAQAVAWAWSPLAAMAFAGSGHVDGLGILLLVGALALGARTAALALLAAGGAVKLLPALLLPYAARALPRPARAWAGALALAAVVAGAHALATGVLPLPRGLGTYAMRWESFDLVFAWLKKPFVAWLTVDGTWLESQRLERGIVLGSCRIVVLAGWLALGLQAWRAGWDVERAGAAITGGFLVLTPTLHPWYVTWMLPFLALAPRASFAWLAAAAPLVYWPLARWRAEGVWDVPDWLWLVVGAPFFGLLARELVRARRAS